MKFYFFIFLFIASDIFAVDTENLSWNRYTNGNFTILSINDQQGKWINDHIQEIKKQNLKKWGFDNFEFSKECRIFCVPNKTLLKELFEINESKVQVFKKDEKIEISVMWLSLDDINPMNSISKYLSQVCFSEYEQKHNINLGLWFKTGASELNCSISKVKEQLDDFSSNFKEKEFLPSSKLFSLDEASLSKESEATQKLFVQESLILCLFLRKEFGQNRLQSFLKISNEEKAIYSIYGFDKISFFDKQYFRYTKDLIRELDKKSVPDFYLKISSI